MRAISFGFHDVLAQSGPDPAADRGHNSFYALQRGKLRDHMAAVRTATGGRVASSVLRADLSAAPTPVFLTFDDGTLGAYLYAADDLDELGWLGHFFVTTDWIGKSGFMDRGHIRDLYRRGHLIGSHSCSHPDWMSRLDWHTLVDEWSRSCGALGDIVGSPVGAASVAGGSSSRNVCRAAAFCGIRALFTSEPTARVSVTDGCLILGRYSVTRSTRNSSVAAIARGAMWPRCRQATLWSAKKAAKRLLGARTWDSIRTHVIDPLPQP